MSLLKRRIYKPRRLHVEQLESRRVFAGHPWQNADLSFDVNADGEVTSQDEREVIDYLNLYGIGALPAARPADAPHLDVNGDDWITPQDLLWVTDQLNETSRLNNLAIASTQPLRVNVAKFQAAIADSSTAGHGSQFATDGFVSRANSWQPSGSGPHWLAVQFPQPTQIGSVQLYLGNEDTNPVANFTLFYKDGNQDIPIPGGTFSGNTSTVLNIVLPSAVTTSQLLLYTNDSTAIVREISAFPPNGPAGFPIATDVTLNLAEGHLATATSVDPGNYAMLAFDGYAGADRGWRSDNDPQGDLLEVDLGVASRIGSAHLYSGSSTQAAIANFQLEYWNGSSWQVVPGTTILGNTQKTRVINFNSAVLASRIRLNVFDGFGQTVRELAVFPASVGLGELPIGTGIVSSEPPTTKFDDLGDGYWALVNRHTGKALATGSGGVAEADGSTTEFQKQFQVLYNIGTDTFRIRNRATGKTLAAENAGTAWGTHVVESDYHAQPWELWRIVAADSAFGYYQNVWNGLVMQSDSGPMTLQPQTGDWKQLWQIHLQSSFPKKGVADYVWDWSKLNVGWNYNWGQDPFGPLPEHVSYAPMQWGAAGVERWPQLYSQWQTDARATALLGFNEPDFPNEDDIGGSDVSVADALALWPQLQAMDLPLVSPAPAITYGGWLADFYGQAEARGFRVDYTGVHWYGPPDANGLLGYLQGIYNTWHRPIWLTEFATVDWSETATWSEEDNYRFMAEFLWRAEDMPWLDRYSIFPFHENAPASPWTRSAPKSAVFNSDRSYTAVGDLYAGWDGDRTVRKESPYVLHNRGTSLHLGSNFGSLKIGNIRENGVDMQWGLVDSWTPGRVHLISLTDGWRLRWNGSMLDFAAPGTGGSEVEWTYTAGGDGYYFIDHPSTGTRLRMNRTNDGNGAPTGVWISMDSSSTVDDNVRWRFVKPAVPGSFIDMPAGWSSQNIGSPGIAGWANFNSSSGTWNVTGSGADIWNTSDQFHLASRSISGDNTIVARVTSQTNTDAWAKAGVMFRNDASAGSTYAAVLKTPGNGVQFQWRSTAGGNSNSVAVTGVSGPIWVKLVHGGNRFRAFYSHDGATWTQIGAAQTVAMNSAALGGLAVTSHDNTELGVATFENVSVVSSPALPGDIDLDGDVDFNDAFTLINNYGLQSGATWSEGDFDHDGDVDFNDAFAQVNNYGGTWIVLAPPALGLFEARSSTTERAVESSRRAIGVPQVAAGSDLVADELFELFDIGEAASFRS